MCTRLSMPKIIIIIFLAMYHLSFCIKNLFSTVITINLDLIFFRMLNPIAI